MLGHTMVGTNDLARAQAFYDAVLAMLGARRLITTGRLAIWGTSRPEFAVCTPHDGQPASVGNGAMVALLAPTRAMVGEVHARALSLGATDEGKPGIRGDNPDGFYGAYFRDLDGNKICIHRRGPEGA